MSGINIYGNIYVKGDSYTIHNGMKYEKVLSYLRKKSNYVPSEKDAESLISIIESNAEVMNDLLTEVGYQNAMLKDTLCAYCSKKSEQSPKIISNLSDYITIGTAALGMVKSYPSFTQKLFELLSTFM